MLETCSGITLEKELTLAPLSGDAGFRNYYRLNSTPSLLAVVAPVANGISERASHFATLSHALRDWGVTVPQVLACNVDRNCMLLEDFGDRLFFNELTDDTVENLYHSALTALFHLQQMPRNRIKLPTYGRSILRRELDLFREWFVAKLLGYSLSMEEQQLIDNTFTFLEEQALAQPQVLVHRDYHSRNLLIREDAAPGIIDFQDAVWGPVTYDIVSLLRDCYLRWPMQQVDDWAVTYGDRAMASGLIPKVSQHRFLQWFDTMGLQRHIKVLGIFARLWLRDNKSQYLTYLPLVLRYILEIADRYRQTRAFAQWLSTRLLDDIERQPWYRDYRVAGNV